MEAARLPIVQYQMFQLEFLPTVSVQLFYWMLQPLTAVADVDPYMV